MKHLLVFILCIVILPFAELCSKPADSKAQSVTARETADSRSNPKITFVELGSVNCIPCKMMVPVMEAIEKKYADQVEVVFHDVWTEEGKPFVEEFGIQVIPTQVFLDADGNEIFRHQGFFPQAEIEELLQSKGIE